jgi:predicted Rossmann fold nucleotide-binding protein DprA/Smf involved in DNA uptake
MGCYEETAEKVVSLLSDVPLLHSYVEQGRHAGCVPVSRISAGYPLRLRKALDLDAPGCIWLKGNADLLNKPSVALVGSRNLQSLNEEFAWQVGLMAAQHGLVLISGNARGADAVAQKSCLEAGGCVISVVADALCRQKNLDRILYISEDGFELPFSSQRALSRNRLIHSMAPVVFVAQCANGTGGTWDGTCRNLCGGWSSVYCLSDGSSGVVRLYKMGAHLVKIPELPQLFAGISTEFGCLHNDVNGNDKMIK